MVVATSIAVSGTLGEVTIPARTADVLEWLRKKYKQPALQFQGKLVHEEESFSVFATPTEEDDENTNQHMLPAPFHEDAFQGVIVILKSTTTNTDEYDKPATANVDLPSAEYDEYYASCTFGDEEEAPVEEEVEEEEEVRLWSHTSHKRDLTSTYVAKAVLREERKAACFCASASAPAAAASPPELREAALPPPAAAAAAAAAGAARVEDEDETISGTKPYARTDCRCCRK
jgi:hypothetical protein